jgi:Leucine-rich repeat (LRR) protein
LGNLTLLDLDNNNLFGVLPTELGLLNKLEFLLLNRNNLSGQIPAEFSGLTALRMAFLDNNKLVGNVAVLCMLPTFQLPRPFLDLQGRELITADCGATAPEIDCVCCSDVDPNCNTNHGIPNLDPTWEASYNRIYFTFGDKTAYVSSVEIPSF